MSGRAPAGGGGRGGKATWEQASASIAAALAGEGGSGAPPSRSNRKRKRVERRAEEREAAQMEREAKEAAERRDGDVDSAEEGELDADEGVEEGEMRERKRQRPLDAAREAEKAEMVAFRENAMGETVHAAVDLDALDVWETVTDTRLVTPVEAKKRRAISDLPERHWRRWVPPGMEGATRKQRKAAAKRARRAAMAARAAEAEAGAVLPGPTMPKPGSGVAPAASDPGAVMYTAGKVWVDKSLDQWPKDDFRLYVGNLGPEVNTKMLTEAFNQYASFAMARAPKDKKTGQSRGYGFVSFLNVDDYTDAFRTMDGKYVGSRPVRLKKSKWRDRLITSEKNQQKLQRLETKTKLIESHRNAQASGADVRGATAALL